MVACVVYFDVATLLDRQSSRIGENGVPQLILCPDRAGRSEISGQPSSLLLHRTITYLTPTTNRRRFGDMGSQFCAYRIEFGFQTVVEHIADHRHPRGPLGHTAEVRMAKLGHATTSGTKCPQDRANRVWGD